jgi:hypothetical protein
MSGRSPQSSWSTTVLTRPPPPSVHHATTGRVHCVLTRVSQHHRRFVPLATTLYRFAMQGPGGDASKQIMSAQGSGHTYLIHAMNTPNGNHIGPHIGTLSRIQMNMHSITYALKDVEGQPIAVVVYQVPNPIQVIRDPPARRAQLAILRPKTVQPALVREQNTATKARKVFAKSCKDSICQHHNLSHVCNDAAIVFQSKTPYVKSGGRIALNFQGRGSDPSPKNMQLVLATTADCTINVDEKNDEPPTKIYMQMCKWEDQMYHLDFSAPLTFLYAFAFGLAQIDL